MSKLLFDKLTGFRFKSGVILKDRLNVAELRELAENLFETEEVFVVWSNTDLTEGRGLRYPHHVCTLGTTAVRLGKSSYVQGSDCPVTQEIAIRFEEGRIHVPGMILGPTEEDERLDAKLKARRAAIEKAKAAGLTDEDLEALNETII